jgi:hypothetical protein
MISSKLASEKDNGWRWVIEAFVICM